MRDEQICAEARRFFQHMVGGVKRNCDFPDVCGAVKNESDSACVEVFCDGGRGDGFEDWDEFTEVHGCLLVARVIYNYVE